jgi:hypothetical protein
VLSIPSLYIPQKDLSDLAYEGDRYLWKCEQHDTWIIPSEFSDAGFTTLQSEYGRGEWTMTGTSIQREYSNGFIRVPFSERKSLEVFFTKRKEFAHGSVWAN